MPPADGSSTVAYPFAANEAVCVSPWIQISQRIYVRPRTGPQSAQLWWPAVAKLQAASVPVCYAATPLDRQTDGQRDGRIALFQNATPRARA